MSVYKHTTSPRPKPPHSHLEGQEMRGQQSCWVAVSVSLPNITKSYKNMSMFLGSFLGFLEKMWVSKS